LLNHPQIMHTLIKEIRQSFKDISEICMGKTLNSCKFLAACIDETMRLSSIIGGCLQREVGPGGITVDGHFIPAGVDVGVPYHVVMRNPRYYKAPTEYRPERWLPSETSPEEIKVARAAFCPFGIGPTGCVGKSWALVEMKLTLAQLLFQYDMQEVGAEGADNRSATQRLQHRERHSLDRFMITNKGPCVRFRLAKDG
jgi:cytochrome P450